MSKESRLFDAVRREKESLKDLREYKARLVAMRVNLQDRQHRSNVSNTLTVHQQTKPYHSDVGRYKIELTRFAADRHGTPEHENHVLMIIKHSIALLDIEIASLSRKIEVGKAELNELIKQWENEV